MSIDYKELARKRAAERNASNWFKLKEGDNCLRILPTPESKKTGPVFHEYRVHREVGAKKQMLRCGHPAASDDSGEPTNCWLCDTQIAKLKAKGHDVRAALLASKEVFVLQVARVDTAGDMTGPFVFNPSPTVANQLLGLIGSPKRDFVDAKKGYNLTINRVGTGRNDTKYTILGPDADPSTVPPEIIKKLKPFSDLTEIPGYSEAKQKAAYFGTEIIDEDEDEEEDDEENHGLVSRPRAAAVVDQEDDPEEEEAQEPAPTRRAAAQPKPKAATPRPAPPKATAGKKAAPVEEEDEEDEDVIVPPRQRAMAADADAEADDDTEADEDDPEVRRPRARTASAVADGREDIDDLDVEEDEDVKPLPPRKRK
jgi:hypothetical protein